MPEALLTVLIPVYNAMPFLRPALGSIQGQTYKNLEILVIDDGSTDGSTEFLTVAAAADHRINLVSRENRASSTH